MDIRYKVKGTQEVGEYVRILLRPEALVEKKETFNPMANPDKGLDFGKIMQQAQNMAVKTMTDDVITIPINEYNKYKYKIGDIVLLNLKTEG